MEMVCEERGRVFVGRRHGKVTRSSTKVSTIPRRDMRFLWGRNGLVQR